MTWQHREDGECKTLARRFRLVLFSFLESEGLPFGTVLPEELIERAFEEEGVPPWSANDEEDVVYTTPVTLWAFLSQMLHKGEQRSCVAAVARVGYSHDQDHVGHGRVAMQDAGNGAPRNMDALVGVQPDSPKHAAIGPGIGPFAARVEFYRRDAIHRGFVDGCGAERPFAVWRVGECTLDESGRPPRGQPSRSSGTPRGEASSETTPTKAHQSAQQLLADVRDVYAKTDSVAVQELMTTAIDQVSNLSRLLGRLASEG